LEEPITLSPRTWEGSAMPFNGVMNPQQLTTLTATLDGFCKIAAIEPDTYEFDVAASSSLRSSMGATTAEGIRKEVQDCDFYTFRSGKVIRKVIRKGSYWKSWRNC
jgi:hypothetical protein